MATATGQQQASALYDQIAGVYDQTRQLPPWLPDRLADVALTLIGGGQPSRILEVGVGTGRVACGFLRPGLVSQYVGVDVSARMLAELDRKFGSAVTPVLGDASALPFDNATFDSVLSCHVLQMVPDLTAVLTEIRRVLRPGGAYLHAPTRWPHTSRNSTRSGNACWPRKIRATGPPSATTCAATRSSSSAPPQPGSSTPSR